jgi:chorismate synthase
MSSDCGHTVRLSIFGESHGPGVGVVIQGLPPGEKIDLEDLYAFLARRRPGQNRLTTTRKESDKPVFLSGVTESGGAVITCGTPLCVFIENQDARSGDYAGFTEVPRPGHADYTAAVRYRGFADMRGSGHFSGRLTAPVCVAGGIAKQILSRKGIQVGAHLYSVGPVQDAPFPLMPTAELLNAVAAKSLPVLNDSAGEEMEREILAASDAGDSVGGIVECTAIGLPPGLGSPMFDGVENRLSTALFGIPAVRGVEFGAGFAAAAMRGSQNNDPFVFQNDRVETTANNHGGILGGITTGMPLLLRAAIKPTPSIAQAQQSVNLTDGHSETLHIAGRHDPCVALRAVPVVEAMTAVVLLDMMMEETDIGDQ